MNFPRIETSGFVVTFRDIPKATTQGNDEPAVARDVLRHAMTDFDEKRQFPIPREPRNRTICPPNL